MSLYIWRDASGSFQPNLFALIIIQRAQHDIVLLIGFFHFQSIHSLFHFRCFPSLFSFSLLKRLSAPSERLPRSNGKIARFPTGFVSELTIPSSGMPSADTGVAPSWDCKQ
jgi:hypothetical protein